MIRLGLIGYPLEHSYSAKHYAEKFRNEKIDGISYVLFPIQNLNNFLDFLRENPEIRGLNVTIPHKKNIMALASRIHPSAMHAGSANTLVVFHKPEPHFHAYNTDMEGFRKSLMEFCPELKGKALVLGNGGSAGAVKAVLRKYKLPHIVVSRTPRKMDEISWKQLDEKLIKGSTLIVNTTPLGMHPEIGSCPPLPWDYIGKEHFLFDLVYNPEESLFIQKGKEKGARTQNGLSMLKYQAEAAWNIWKNKKIF